MKRILFLLFLSLTLNGLASNEVIVTGRVNRPETLVRLMVYDDLLNMHEMLVAETTSDSQGFFLLEGEIPCFLPGRIAVGLESVDLFLTPGASYDVTITIPEQDPQASYFERLSPTLKIKTASDKGAYRQMIISEQIIDDYILNYFDELYRRHQYRYLDSIRATIDAELEIRNDDVKHQNDYKIASVQMAVNADGGKKVIKEYYDGKPVLYNCQAYMDLFKDLFKTFEVTEEFASRNPALSEMIQLYQLRGLYYSDSQSRRWVRAQLKSIAGRSKTSQTKTLIANMEARFNRFARGADAPDFELEGLEGNRVKLSDFKDSMVLLQFVEGSSKTVDHQFETLSELHRQWQDSVQLVTVSTKDQLSVWKKRFEDSHYDWPLLNLGNEILLLEQYEVRTFPEYILLLPNNKIGMAPAPNPDRGLGESVTKLLQ